VPKAAPNAEEDLLTGRPFAVVVALATVVLTVGVAATGSTSTVRNGQIAWKAFARVDGTWSIYAANPDGSNRRRLTHPAVGVEDDLPDWSPNGSNVVFERIFQPATDSPTVADEVMRVNADGTGLRQIGSCTGDCVYNDDPQYSPDGSQIVYSRLMRVHPSDTLVLGIWVMNADGSDSHQLTQLAPPASSEDHEPAWSPDSKNLVFTRVNDSAAPMNHQALFIVSSSGGTPHRVTPWTLDAGGANWSPDGSKILFQSYRDCSCSQTSQVYTIAPGGSRLNRLTTAGSNIEPNWSPDGKKIVYAHQPWKDASQLPDLWLMDATSKNKKPVIQTKLWDSEPDWGTAPPTP
jgi:Tol biopolymer transport system component